MRKSHLNDEFLVLLVPIISRFFACSNEEKRMHALVLSLWWSVIMLNVVAPYLSMKLLFQLDPLLMFVLMSISVRILRL